MQPDSLKYLLVEIQLMLQELEGHWTSPLLDVAHSVPRLRSSGEKTGYVKVDTREVLHNAGVAQSQLAVHLVENVLLSGGDTLVGMLPVEGERHIDAVQRHPVNLTLPALPVPMRVAIAERADVHVVTVLGQDLQSHAISSPTSCFHSLVTRGRGMGMAMWSPVPSSPHEIVELQ